MNGFENQQLVNLLSIAHNKICEHVLDAVDFKVNISELNILFY